jgi:hypothetical protein
MLAIVLSVIALAPVFLISYYYTGRTTVPVEQPIGAIQFEVERPKMLEAGQTFNVRACRVLDGYRFELYLEGGKWIEAHLKVAAKDEASAIVLECFNKASPPSPTVTLLRQVGHYWIVDFHLTMENRRENLTDFLKAKGLLL